MSSFSVIVMQYLRLGALQRKDIHLVLETQGHGFSSALAQVRISWLVVSLWQAGEPVCRRDNLHDEMGSQGETRAGLDLLLGN